MNPLITALLEALFRQTSLSIPLNSSACASVDVSGGGDCTVTMQSGQTYDITEAQAVGLLSASSPGQYFNAHIKNR